MQECAGVPRLALALMLATPVLAQDVPALPAGTCRPDRGPARLLFQVNPIGVSNCTALFAEMDATLMFGPENPEGMTLTATVNPASVETHSPDPAMDFNAIITGTAFPDSAAVPDITFTSTGATLTGAGSADVTGDLTLHGVTRPLTRQVASDADKASPILTPAVRASDFPPRAACSGPPTVSPSASPHRARPSAWVTRSASSSSREFTNPDAKAP